MNMLERVVVYRSEGGVCKDHNPNQERQNEVADRYGGYRSLAGNMFRKSLKVSFGPQTLPLSSISLVAWPVK